MIKIFEINLAKSVSILYRIAMAETTTAPKQFKNKFRITLDALAKEHGFHHPSDFIGTLDDSIVPACCSESCEVEPDGRCEHGCPSALLAAGII